MNNLTPQDMALMQMGFGMLNASGPSPKPVGLGQAFGQAGMQGLGAYQNAVGQEQQAALFKMKMEEAKRQEMERAQQQAVVAEMSKKHPELAQLFQIDPKLAIQYAYPKPEKPQVVGPGAALVGPDGKPVYQHPGKPEPSPTEVREYEYARNNGFKGTFTEFLFQKRKAGAPTVVNDLRQEGEFSKKVGAQMGDMYSDLLKADMNAPATIAKYDRLGALLGSVNTGKFKGTTTELKAAAKSSGIDLTALGITDDVAPAQAARALSNQLALELRNPAGGAGMPGALSDKDREFLQQSLPSLESDPGAVTKMIEYRQKLARREQQVARMAREYRRKHGKFDEGFFDQLQDWSEKNPLFPEAGKAKIKVYNPSTGKIEEQ